MFPLYAKLKTEPPRITREPAVVRTEMESGPPKQARIRSRVMVQRHLTYIFGNQLEYTEFLYWFATEAAYGAAWFEWSDPFDDKIKMARIANGALEERGNTTWDVWEIGMTIETWDA